jgi:type I restriction enzyme S subunit
MTKEWPLKTLGDVCQLISGQHIDAKDYNTESRGVGYLTGPSDFGPLHPVITKWTEHPKITAKRGDVLITVKGSGVGRINLLDEDEVAISRQLMAVRVTGAEPSFIHAILSSTFDHFQSLSTGAAIPGISREQVLGLTIALPPLAEQQRIVGLLDEVVEGLATAKSNAEKNLQNARALFKSHLQSVLTQRGPGWKTTTLGAEIDLLAGFAFKSAKYTNSNDDIRLLRGDNIIQGCLRWDDVKKWPANDTLEYGRYQLEEGDVVLAMDRPWVKAGLKHATISADDLPCLLVQRTARLRGGANLDNRFLKLLIGSAAFTSHILGVQTGIGVPHISGQQIKDFEFARPPLAEQRRIADNLESLREETQRLGRVYEQKCAALDALKKSLLHQAFAGQLTPAI